MTATDATVTPAIPEIATASIPIPAKAAPTAVAPQDAANLPANEGTAQVAKEPAVAAKPALKAAIKAAAKVSARAATQVAKKTTVAAKPAVKSVTRLPAKAVATPAAQKTTVAAKPAGKTAPAVQAVLKPSAKPILKETPKASLKQAVNQKAEKALKEKKPKLVRDSFTIPKVEYTVLDDLKHRAGKLGTSIKKSELIRAGIKALASMPDAMYLGALKVVPTVKTGRPSKK